jgi:hypothetical protein
LRNKVEKQSRKKQSQRNKVEKQSRNKQKMQQMNIMNFSRQFEEYNDIWSRCMSIGGESDTMTQSEFYKKYITKDPDDFTDVFHRFNLGELFTSSKIVTKMLGNFNCNNVYRQTFQVPDILVYSDKNYMVLQPLGEPGRDVPDFKIGHFMIVNHNDENVKCLNEMIPTSVQEKKDLETRHQVLMKAYNALFDNVPANTCGGIVSDKLKSLGLNETTNIREFLAYQIYNIPELVRTGTPGYKLMVGGEDISTDLDKINSEIIRVYDQRLRIYSVIQGPNFCSQLLSHVHAFLYWDGDSQFNDEFYKTYISVDDIITYNNLETQMEPEPEQEEPDDGTTLCRQRSVRNPIPRQFTGVV